jgi:hypothetical protein
VESEAGDDGGDATDMEDDPDDDSYIARAARGLHDAQDYGTIDLTASEEAPVEYRPFREPSIVAIFKEIAQRERDSGTQHSCRV